MKTLKSAAFGLAAVALLSAAGLAAPASAAMTMHEKMMVKSCMAMPGEGMLHDSGCKALMNKMNISDSDMQTLIMCRGMTHDGMMDNPDCVSMMKMHPKLMKAPMTN